jgi:hypothetical protein
MTESRNFIPLFCSRISRRIRNEIRRYFRILIKGPGEIDWRKNQRSKISSHGLFICMSKKNLNLIFCLDTGTGTVGATFCRGTRMPVIPINSNESGKLSVPVLVPVRTGGTVLSLTLMLRSGLFWPSQLKLLKCWLIKLGCKIYSSIGTVSHWQVPDRYLTYVFQVSTLIEGI